MLVSTEGWVPREETRGLPEIKEKYQWTEAGQKCPTTKIAIVAHGKAFGSSVKVCVGKKCPVHKHPGVGGASTFNEKAWRERQKEQERKRRLDAKWKATLFGKISDGLRDRAALPSALLAIAAETILTSQWGRIEEYLELCGSKESRNVHENLAAADKRRLEVLRARFKKLGANMDRELVRVAIASASRETGGIPKKKGEDPWELAAAVLGIDVEKLRAEVLPNEEPKAATKKKTATPATGKAKKPRAAAKKRSAKA
jgi:hypothetical protein